MKEPPTNQPMPLFRYNINIGGIGWLVGGSLFMGETFLSINVTV